MVDPYLLLTPILVLGIVALLGFVGCDIVWRVTNLSIQERLLICRRLRRPERALTLAASLPDLGGGNSQLIVVTVEWGGNATVTLSGSTFTQIETDNLNPQNSGNVLCQQCQRAHHGDRDTERTNNYGS